MGELLIGIDAGTTVAKTVGKDTTSPLSTAGAVVT